MTTLTITKLEVDGCARCPFNQCAGVGTEYCMHPTLAKRVETDYLNRTDIPGVHLDPDKGAPDWCPLRKEEILVTWEGKD